MLGNGPAKLLEYEWKLEDLFRRQPALCGICQYHVDTLPRDMVLQGIVAHPTIFINETLSRLNPHYIPSEARSGPASSSHFEDLLQDVSPRDND